MKRSLTLYTFAAMTLASQAHAQATASATASVSANVLSPISVTKTTDLSFGSMIRPGSGANTIVISAADGTRSISGAGTGALSASSPTRAQFSVGGDGGQAFSISAPASVNITRSGGSETIAVTLTPSAATGALSGTTGNAGAATFGVGGSLPIDNTTVIGSYTGAFQVTVGYN